MPIGLRASEANRIQEFCIGDKRLLMRLGALLHIHICFSEAVLEEISRSPQLRKLIMDRSLSNPLDEKQFADILQKHHTQDMGLMFTYDQQPGPESEQEPGQASSQVSSQSTQEESAQTWLCIHLDDELNNPLLQEQTAEQEAPEEIGDSHQWLRSVSELLPTLSTAIRTPIEGLLAAQGDEQRAAAIEQLRYAAPSLAVVSEIMPVILSDGADIVRERGISLLINAGASPIVTDIIRALQRGDDNTLHTLGEHLDRLPPDQQELIFAALIATATRGVISNAMVFLSTHIAELMSQHRGLHRYMELLLLHGNQLSLIGFIRQLQKFNTNDIDSILKEFLGQGKESDARILVLYAHDDAVFSNDMIELGVNLMLSPDEEPKERMALANALRRMHNNNDNDGKDGKENSHSLSALFAQRAQNLEHSRDSTVYWLLAELSKNKQITCADANIISIRLRGILKRANGPHVVSILDHQLPAVLPCDHLHSSQMVEPLAELLARFRDDRSQGHIMNCLEKMGTAAIDPLWEILASHPTAAVRSSCAQIFPQLCAHYNDADTRKVITRLMQESEKAATAADKCVFYLAAARLLLTVDDAQNLEHSIDSAAQVIALEGIDACALIAASQHVDPNRRLEIMDSLIDLICADLPDGQSEEHLDPATQDVTFVLDDTISTHTHMVPRALNGLLVIASSAPCPPQLQRRITMTLMNQWRKVSRWEVMWGPGNVYYLAKTLSDLASLPSFPETLRLQVAESLGPRSMQLRIAEYVLCIIVSSNSKKMHNIAHKAIKRILHDCNAGQYADDEFSDLCHILAQFLALDFLGSEDSSIPMQVARTISMHQNNCSLRCKELLHKEFATFSDSVRGQLDWLNG